MVVSTRRFGPFLPPSKGGHGFRGAFYVPVKVSSMGCDVSKGDSQSPPSGRACASPPSALDDLGPGRGYAGPVSLNAKDRLKY